LNSSEAEPWFAGFLGRSLRVLERENPRIAGEVARRLGRRAVAVDVGGERFQLRSDGCEVRVDVGYGEPAVRIAVRARTMLDLLEARETLLGAALGGRLVLRGRADEIAVFHDALTAWLHGAVRSPGFEALLVEFGARIAADEEVSDVAGS